MSPKKNPESNYDFMQNNKKMFLPGWKNSILKNTAKKNGKAFRGNSFSIVKTGDDILTCDFVKDVWMFILEDILVTNKEDKRIKVELVKPLLAKEVNVRKRNAFFLV